MGLVAEDMVSTSPDCPDGCKLGDSESKLVLSVLTTPGRDQVGMIRLVGPVWKDLYCVKGVKPGSQAGAGVITCCI